MKKKKKRLDTIDSILRLRALEIFFFLSTPQAGSKLLHSAPYKRKVLGDDAYAIYAYISLPLLLVIIMQILKKKATRHLSMCQTFCFSFGNTRDALLPSTDTFAVHAMKSSFSLFSLM